MCDNQMKCGNCKEFTLHDWLMNKDTDDKFKYGDCGCNGPGDAEVRGDGFVKEYLVEFLAFCSKFEGK